MPVINKHHGNIPSDAIYIGRGGPWGNPFTHQDGTTAEFKVATRDEAVDRYEQWLEEQVRNGEIEIPTLAALHGKTLVCFCKPERCHGDVLERAANWAHRLINEAGKRRIFVFGSNLAGRHGAGAALEAKNNHGAIYGQGIGLQGDSYAIPTKDGRNNQDLKLAEATLPLDTIRQYVAGFIEFARVNPNLHFDVCKIGCGLAGYTPEEIAPMFRDAPDNCTLPEGWRDIANQGRQFTWAKGGGFECSTQGDKRFSAFNALMPDGRSIEHHYQCDVKGYEPGGTNWKLGKGKPALDPKVDLWDEYLKLWETWARAHPQLIEELRAKAQQHSYILCDRFANTPVNQAHALAHILNHGCREAPQEQTSASTTAGNTIEGLPKIAVIGTAGRQKNMPLNRQLWEWMVKDADRRLPAQCHLVSGGAAWADHLAVYLFIHQRVQALTLHLPAPFDEEKCCFVGGYGTSGGAENYYHKRFSQAIREDSLFQIRLAIQMGASGTFEHEAQGYRAMFVRNKLVAKNVIGMLAYTFGPGDQPPEDSGTLDTWNQFQGEKLHISLPR